MNIHSLDLGLARAYLLETATGLYLVDAGAPGSEDRVLSCMHAIDRKDLRLIFITHAHLDHYGSAGALRRLTGAPVAIHYADAEAMTNGETHLGSVRGRGKLVKYFMPLINFFMKLEPVKPDIVLEDGDALDSFDLDASLLHLPGHTPGSSALLVDGDYFFVGDLLSTSGEPHLQKYYASDWSQIPISLARLREHQPRWVYPGHGACPLAGADLEALSPDREE